MFKRARFGLLQLEHWVRSFAFLLDAVDAYGPVHSKTVLNIVRNCRWGDSCSLGRVTKGPSNFEDLEDLQYPEETIMKRDHERPRGAVNARRVERSVAAWRARRPSCYDTPHPGHAAFSVTSSRRRDLPLSIWAAAYVLRSRVVPSRSTRRANSMSCFALLFRFGLDSDRLMVTY